MNKKKGMCLLADLAIPVDHKFKMKEIKTKINTWILPESQN